MTIKNEEDVLRCAYNDGRRATLTLQVESQGVLMVCSPCGLALKKKVKNKRCQYCGVPIIKDWKKSALPGFEHTVNCPRSTVAKVTIEVPPDASVI